MLQLLKVPSVHNKSVLWIFFSFFFFPFAGWNADVLARAWQCVSHGNYARAMNWNWHKSDTFVILHFKTFFHVIKITLILSKLHNLGFRYLKVNLFLILLQFKRAKLEDETRKENTHSIAKSVVETIFIINHL